VQQNRKAASVGVEATTATVVIVPYDPRWPAMFANERERILTATGGVVLAVEHVGSTAVPGLAAKPIIDILAGVRHLDDAAETFQPLLALGYAYVPEYETEIPDRRYFHKGPPAARSHHLHMAEFGGGFWRRHLAFRDALRSDPVLAARYAALKRDLAARFGRDRRGYTEAKTEFIESVLADFGSPPGSGSR